MQRERSIPPPPPVVCIFLARTLLPDPQTITNAFTCVYMDLGVDRGPPPRTLNTCEYT